MAAVRKIYSTLGLTLSATAADKMQVLIMSNGCMFGPERIRVFW